MKSNIVYIVRNKDGDVLRKDAHLITIRNNLKNLITLYGVEGAKALLSEQWTLTTREHLNNNKIKNLR